MERQIEGLMNRVVWKKVSQQKRRGMRSLSLSSPVASSPRAYTHKHTHNPHFISDGNNAATPCVSAIHLSFRFFLSPTLLCPNTTFSVCSLIVSVLHSYELLNCLHPDPFLSPSLLFPASGIHTHQWFLCSSHHYYNCSCQFCALLLFNFCCLPPTLSCI